jgi:hypothetical protein
MKKLLMLAAIVLLASSSAISAQQQPPNPQPSVSVKKAEPVQLLLEIQYNPDVPPAYSTVRGSDEKVSWVWVTRFIRIPGAQTGKPIEAVKLESQFNGETAAVRVTLLRGDKGFDQEDLLGVYHVGVGEQKMINDLRAAGVEPFSITLLNTVPPLPPPPAFENQTKSVEIASVRSENLPKPAYVVTFRNLSDKNLQALRIDVRRDGRPGTSAFFQHEDGRPIIEPGGTGERYLGVETARRTATGYAPETAASNTIVIRGAVFADMSFEGDVEVACSLESMKLGRRLWLQQVLPLIDQELTKPIEDSIAAARQFKAKFSTLIYEFDEPERNRASSVSSACATRVEMAEVGPKLLKLRMLRDLDEVIDKQPSPPVNFKAWLEARRTYYKAWLARL